MVYFIVYISLTVSYKNGTKLKPPSPNITNSKNNWIIFSQWGEWSACTTCGEFGERERDGKRHYFKYRIAMAYLTIIGAVLSRFLDRS